ncbi:MAG: lysophospholipid acyltransferase family protein [Pyrinomonadaceae bacterium]
MNGKIDAAFEFQPLNQYSFGQRLKIRTSGMAFYLVTRIIGATMRFETIGGEFSEQVREAGKLPIYTFWHDRIVSSTYYFRDKDIIVLSSQSYDSEFTARCIQRFGFGIVKGSSSRGAVAGLVGLIRMMKKGFPSAFTVDGPKGPRYEAKAGPLMLAKKTGNPVLPFVIECRRFWRLGSWDKLQIPKPFTPAAVIFAEPIYVDAKADGDEIETKRLELQKALDELVEKGSGWRKGEI